MRGGRGRESALSRAPHEVEYGQSTGAVKVVDAQSVATKVGREVGDLYLGEGVRVQRHDPPDRGALSVQLEALPLGDAKQLVAAPQDSGVPAPVRIYQHGISGMWDPTVSQEIVAEEGKELRRVIAGVRDVIDARSHHRPSHSKSMVSTAETFSISTCLRRHPSGNESVS